MSGHFYIPGIRREDSREHAALSHEDLQRKVEILTLNAFIAGEFHGKSLPHLFSYHSIAIFSEFLLFFTHFLQFFFKIKNKSSCSCLQNSQLLAPPKIAHLKIPEISLKNSHASAQRTDYSVELSRGSTEMSVLWQCFVVFLLCDYPALICPINPYPSGSLF